MACQTAVCPDTLHKHLKKDLKEIGLTASRTYCMSVAKAHGIPPRAELRLPTSVIPAIYGLPIQSNMHYCGNCGYAARIPVTIRLHQAGTSTIDHCRNKKCEGSGILTGYAQTFFPKSNRDFFAVKVPLATASKPDRLVPISTRFNGTAFWPPW